MAFYRTFSEKQLTGLGGARRGKIERSRLALLKQHIQPPGPMLTAPICGRRRTAAATFTATRPTAATPSATNLGTSTAGWKVMTLDPAFLSFMASHYDEVSIPRLDVSDLDLIVYLRSLG